MSLLFRLSLLLICLTGALRADPAWAENRLQGSISAHLLQHAGDPIAWHPWGEEALARAREEQKLIFLSMGHGACRGCRAMGRESFADPATAALLNRHYVSILVDREERPDLEGYFMPIVTAMTGRGGWPLTLILTPDVQPLFGGGYFPLEATPEGPSLKAVLTALQAEWQGDREGLLKRLDKTSRWLREQRELSTSPPPVGNPDPRPAAVAFWQQRLDARQPGEREGQAPQPLALSLLMRHASRHREVAADQVALQTLDRMGAGGVRDQLAGAFHPYALDRHWQVPHFALHLPDNALLVRAYLEAYQWSGRAHYALVVREVLGDLLRRLQLPGGCFAASLTVGEGADAQAYYTWSAEEITSLLGPQQAASFMELFFDPVEGVVEGRSVLRLLGGLESLPQSRRESEEARQRLLAAREKRPPPLRDEKMVTSWNGLMISALARAGAVLQEEGYLTAARACMADMQRAFPSPEALRHSRRGERSAAEVFLDDYAFMAQAALDLYEADFDLHHLQQANRWMSVLLARFQTEADRSLSLTPREMPSIIPHRTVWEDGLQPAGHSVAWITLQRLALFSPGSPLEKALDAMRPTLLAHWAGEGARAPELFRLLEYQPDVAVEVVIVGARSHPATQALLRETGRRLIPGLVLGLVEPGQEEAVKAWSLLAGRRLLNGEPTAYVCRNLVCRLPVNRAEDLAKMLEGNDVGP
ncbi:MAG: DUF255 domain-containing protein [Magnetococcus sp. MYC-9]